jgi:hypothetical protein
MMGGTMEGVMEANVAKLKRRYPAGFPVKETMVDRWPIKEDS